MTPPAQGPGDAQAILESYLQELPLDDARRSALRVKLAPALQRARTDAGARTAVLTELHRALGGDAEFDTDNPAKASLATRLGLAMAGAHKRGDDHAAGIFTTDVQGRARLVTTPPLARASMIFLPWANNPFSRFWRWSLHAVFGLRGMAPVIAGSRAPMATDQRPLWPWLLTRLFLAALLVSQIGNIKHLVPSPLGQKVVLAGIVFAMTLSLFGLFGSRGINPQAADPRPEGSPDRRVRWRASGRNRRLFLISLIFAQTWFATYYMTAVLPYHGSHVLEKAILVLYVILFVWVSLGFWTALMGFFTLLISKDRHSINASAAPDLPIPAQVRTAILIPICNEDVARVYAGLRATYDSVMRSGKGAHFDFYILSDTSKADVRVAELEAWLRLCREVDGFGRIYYRRRHHRIKRKSGNIADWCRRWGSLYQYMIILDADSVMSGACLVRLTQLMEANRGAGIIQTAPRAAGRDTAYARIQQFATRAYGPLFTAGLHFWQLGESHYWGHNAIIRVQPFMQHCALGRLPGRGALAGEIMSHDFVEAALMRRAGWAVWIAYDLPGSYEEMPPALLDELRRDQRWCQGNLQNFRLFLTRGLHPAHRAVFMTGVMAYISAPLWFLFLALSTALLWVQMKTEPEYFTQPEQLFPTWPEWHPEWAAGLAGLTAVLLFLPKVLGAVLILARRSELKLYGGPFKLIDSLFLEMIFSALLAPVRMLFHTRYVTFAMLGFAVQWKSPPRDDAQTPWSEAIRRHVGGTILGIAWIVLVHWLNPSFLPWLLPVAGAMVVAIPLSVVSSRVDLGRWLRERRLFLIPEETFPPRELRWTRAAHRKSPNYDGGFERAIEHPITNAIAAAAANPRDRLPQAARTQRTRLVTLALEKGAASLNEAQRNALLSDPAGLVLLHQKHWAEAKKPQGGTLSRHGAVAATASIAS